MNADQVVVSILLAFLVFGAGQSAVAGPLDGQQRNPMNRRAFSIHDTDLDGYLSRSEFQNIRRAEKGQGKEEAQSRGAGPRFLQFNRVDTDHDGLVSEDELVDALNQRLKAHRQHRYRNMGYPH